MASVAPRASSCCQGAVLLPVLLLAASCTVIVAEAGEKGRQLAVGMVILKNNTVVFGGDATRGAPGTAKYGAISWASLSMMLERPLSARVRAN
jgi:hypothetical protein